MEDRKNPNMIVLEETEGETSRAEFPPGMAPKMLKLVKVLNDLETKMEPLISKPHHDVLSKLPPLERAKVGLMEVYTINSLFWVLMKTSGENIDSTLRDDYKVEMGRLKETQGRLAELEARAHRRGVDVQVASRFIQRGLGINQRRGMAEDEEGMEEEEEEEETHVMPEEASRRGHHHQSWAPQHMNNQYQEEVDGGQQEYPYPEEEQEEVQPTAFVNKTTKKKKKKNRANTITHFPDENYEEQTHENSGYQASGSELENSVPSSKGKKKRKSKDNGTQQADEEVGQDTNEDEQFAAPASRKKQKKKAKQGANVTASDIAAFLDTTRGGINYEIEDDSESSNKGRNWYEQGWT